jgi:hypothetical protein
MSGEKFLFKIHRNGRVERVKDSNNLTISDVLHGLGIPKRDVECKPLKNSGIYAFFGDKSDILIFGVLERHPANRQVHENDAVRGILASQFSILCPTLKETLS